MVSEKQIACVADAIDFALGDIKKARLFVDRIELIKDVVRKALTAAEQAEPAPAARSGAGEVNEPVANHWPKAHEVADIVAGGKGFWRSCSGCHELNDGHPTGPWSVTLGCNLGCGCFECGGIGAVWDTTDYADMGETLSALEPAVNTSSSHVNETAENEHEPAEPTADFDEAFSAAYDFIKPKLLDLHKEKGAVGVWTQAFRSGWDAAKRAEPAADPEPYAWEVIGAELHRLTFDEIEARKSASRFGGVVKPLYTSPQPAADAEPVWGIVRQKFYHSQWTTAKLLEARREGEGLITDEGEAWFYEHTSADGAGGRYDLLFRREPTSPQTDSRLREALEPFARLANELFRTDGGHEMNAEKKDDAVVWGFDSTLLTYGDFRRARAALAQGGGR